MNWNCLTDMGGNALVLPASEILRCAQDDNFERRMTRVCQDDIGGKLWLILIKADDADEQDRRDILKTTEEGRYIGGVRDKSAPTGIPCIV